MTYVEVLCLGCCTIGVNQSVSNGSVEAVAVAANLDARQCIQGQLLAHVARACSHCGRYRELGRRCQWQGVARPAVNVT